MFGGLNSFVFHLNPLRGCFLWQILGKGWLCTITLVVNFGEGKQRWCFNVGLNPLTIFFTSPLVSYHLFARDIETSTHAIVLNLYPQKTPLIINTKNDGDMVSWHLGRYFILSLLPKFCSTYHPNNVISSNGNQCHNNTSTTYAISKVANLQLLSNQFSISGFKPWKTTLN